MLLKKGIRMRNILKMNELLKNFARKKEINYEKFNTHVARQQA